MTRHVTVFLNFVFLNSLKILTHNETQKIVTVYYKSCTTTLTRHDLMQRYKNIKTPNIFQQDYVVFVQGISTTGILLK